MYAIILFETFLCEFLCTGNLHFHFEHIFQICRPERGALPRAILDKEKKKGKAEKQA